MLIQIQELGNLIRKNMNNITNDTTSSNYNNMSEPNIPKENKYFKINKSYDKKEEEILSMSNEELNKKDYKKNLLIDKEK